MRIKLQLTAIFCFLTIICWSQKKDIDEVYLNDGSIIKGSILEYFKGDHLIIESKTGNVYDFKATDIKSVNPSNQTDFDIKNGYFNNTSFGVLIGENSYNNPLVNFTFNMINGYQFNERFQVGAGIGMDVIYRQLLFPVFLDLKYYLRKSSFSPYIGVYAGHSYQNKKEETETNPWDYYYYENNIKSGHMYGAQIGIRNYTRENLGYTLSLGYRFQYLSSTYQDWNYNVEVLEEHYLNRFKLTLGIIFN